MDIIQSHHHEAEPAGGEAPRSKREALLSLLRDGHWHPSFECAAVGGVSFQASIYAFRRRGWKVEARRVHGHLYEYRINGHAEPVPTAGLSRPQLRVMREVCLAVRKVYGADGLDRVVAQLPPRLQDEARRP